MSALINTSARSSCARRAASAFSSSSVQARYPALHSAIEATTVCRCPFRSYVPPRQWNAVAFSVSPSPIFRWSGSAPWSSKMRHAFSDMTFAATCRAVQPASSMWPISHVGSRSRRSSATERHRVPPSAEAPAAKWSPSAVLMLAPCLSKLSSCAMFCTAAVARTLGGVSSPPPVRRPLLRAPSAASARGTSLSLSTARSRCGRSGGRAEHAPHQCASEARSRSHWPCDYRRSRTARLCLRRVTSVSPRSGTGRA
eukprot:scaffold86253_cov66-Phaeocystis_antarctica.AAC.5